jgi:hypothetical protein
VGLLVLALLGGLAGLVAWIIAPPPERCPLPLLDVPRAGRATWSLDGTELLVGNVDKAAYLVAVPEGKARSLPPNELPIAAFGRDTRGRLLAQFASFDTFFREEDFLNERLGRWDALSAKDAARFRKAINQN